MTTLYTVRETFGATGYGPIIGAAPTLAEAFALIPGKLICAEPDPDHPGFADAFPDQGRIFVIEPTTQKEPA
jgi:hypothetical protein